MASIAEWIERIKTAIYGEEVRGAIWQSLEAMNTEVEAINVDGDQIQTNKTNIAANTAAITALNSRLTNSFYIKAMGQSGGANNTLKITSTGADTLEHLILAYGCGSGQKIFCFVMYSRKSTNTISILNLSSALEGTASFDSDGNILVKLSSWMSGYIFSRHDVNVSYTSS